MLTDGPTPDQCDEYVQNVLEPLSQGEGIACFLITHSEEPDDDDTRHVLYCTHAFKGRSHELATNDAPGVRAAQAVAIQREARLRAREHGFHCVIDWTEPDAA